MVLASCRRRNGPGWLLGRFKRSSSLLRKVRHMGNGRQYCIALLTHLMRGSPARSMSPRSRDEVGHGGNS